jgi:hypothetical protein
VSTNSAKYAIALADFNGDGLVDIVVGNKGQENQIMIKHKWGV